MYSFKDFTVVQYAGGETEQQDLNAFKRKHRNVTEESGSEKIRKNFQEKRHPQLKVTDHVKEAEAAKGKDPQALSKIKDRLKKK